MTMHPADLKTYQVFVAAEASMDLYNLPFLACVTSVGKGFALNEQALKMLLVTAEVVEAIGSVTALKPSLVFRVAALAVRALEARKGELKLDLASMKVAGTEKPS